MYDVIVVGGGAAGLSGALMLARSKRSVLVVDAGAPRNAPAAGVHGLLGHDGISPLELLERGRAEVRGYGGEVISGSVESVSDGFTVTLVDGRTFEARRILVTTGLVDELPDIPGLRERWGRDVVHCPYCHGWEVRDRPIGVIASGPMSAHQARLFRQLSDDVTFFTNGVPLDEDLAGISVVDGAVAGVEVDDDRLVGVRLRVHPHGDGGPYLGGGRVGGRQRRRPHCSGRRRRRGRCPGGGGDQRRSGDVASVNSFAASRSRSSTRRILPEMVFGSSANSMRRIRLYGARFSRQ
jgi:hypothetical protein